MTAGDGSLSCDGQRGGSGVRFCWRKPLDIQGMGRRHHLGAECVCGGGGGVLPMFLFFHF